MEDYRTRAARTINLDILNDKRELLMNACLGICGEAGEFVDIVKKWAHQGHDLDVERLEEELGDICWYIAEACTALGLDWEGLLNSNIEKLLKRYPIKFTTSDSINRSE